MSRIERVDFGLYWSWGGILEVMRRTYHRHNEEVSIEMAGCSATNNEQKETHQILLLEKA